MNGKVFASICLISIFALTAIPFQSFKSSANPLLVVAPVIQSNGNMLRNSGFEEGLIGWDGAAKNYAKYDCSQKRDNPAKDGKCFAWFENADGSSFRQDFKGTYSGKFTAAAYVRGEGQKVTLALWRWCGGAPENTSVDVTAAPGTWTFAKVSTPDMKSCTMLRWELYLGNKQLELDNTRLFKEY